jgi:hypothetical protein
MVTGWVRLGKRRTQGRLLLLGEQRLMYSPRTALVAHTVGSSAIVATRDLADPVRRVAGHSCDGGGGQATRQQPVEMPAAALDGIVSMAVVLMQFVVGQIGLEADAFWHAQVLQQSRVTRYHLTLNRIRLSPSRWR